MQYNIIFLQLKYKWFNVHLLMCIIVITTNQSPLLRWISTNESASLHEREKCWNWPLLSDRKLHSVYVSLNWSEPEQRRTQPVDNFYLPDLTRSRPVQNFCLCNLLKPDLFKTKTILPTAKSSLRFKFLSQGFDIRQRIYKRSDDYKSLNTTAPCMKLKFFKQRRDGWWM